MKSRRELIAALGGAGIISVSGCVQESLGPSPEVVDSATDAGSLSGTIGDTTFEILVVNHRGVGEVEVILELADENGVTLDRYAKIVDMREEERRRVSFELAVPDGTARYLARAEPASGVYSVLPTPYSADQ